MLTNEVQTRHLYDVTALVRPPIRTASALGVRSTSLVLEGTVTGERIFGQLVSAGGDWMLVDAAGIGHVDARYLIETADGAVIQTFYSGRVVFHGDSLDRLRAGHALAEDDTYIRVAPTFHAPAPYDWLNRLQAIGIGRVEPGSDGQNIVHYRVFEVL